MISIPNWVPLLEGDIDEVDRIARIIHETLPERKEVFAEKRDLFPQGCYQCVFDGQMIGYAIAHPWNVFSIPPLDEFLYTLPHNPDCIYIHDVVVLPEARGHHAAERFIAQISQVAREMRIKKLACVSVYGTDVLWSRFGFRAVTSLDMETKIASYGESAKYMVADVEAFG